MYVCKFELSICFNMIAIVFMKYIEGRGPGRILIQNMSYYFTLKILNCVIPDLKSKQILSKIVIN